MKRIQRPAITQCNAKSFYILLLAPSVCELGALLKICERELIQLDMAINFKKSCCLRIGPRMNVPAIRLVYRFPGLMNSDISVSIY